MSFPSLMQEAGVVEGEVSAWSRSVVCSQGLTHPTFRPCRAHSRRSHVRGRGEDPSWAMGLGAVAGNGTQPGVWETGACGLAAGRRHVGSSTA